MFDRSWRRRIPGDRSSNVVDAISSALQSVRVRVLEARPVLHSREDPVSESTSDGLGLIEAIWALVAVRRWSKVRQTRERHGLR